MPLLFKHTEPLWGVWKTDETSQHLLSSLSGETTDYRSFLETMKTENRKKEWLATRLLTKELIGEEAFIDYRPSGAPFLPGRDLNISISHTKGFVAVLLSHTSVAGIDIEYRGNRILKIRNKFMSEEEESHIDTAHQVDHLLIYWCAKETLFKVIGKERVDFRNHLYVHPFPYKEKGSLLASETLTRQTASYNIMYNVFPDFIVTLTL